MSRRSPVKIRGGVVVQGGIGLRDKSDYRTVTTPPNALYRALVVNTRVAKSEEGAQRYMVECDVILVRTSLAVLSVPVLQREYGINNLHDLWVPKPSTRVMTDPTAPLNLSGRFSKRGDFLGDVTALDDTDGDMVVLSYMDGSTELPIIVGAIPHERARRFILSGPGWDESDGGSTRGQPNDAESYTSHNGTETRINASGDVLVDTVGATTDKVNEVPDPSGGQIRFRVKSAEHFTVEMDGLDALEVYKDGSQIRVDLGEGAAERLVLGDSLMAFMNNFFSAFNAHVHPTGVGPSGPPATPVSNMTEALLSDLAKTRKT